MNVLITLPKHLLDKILSGEKKYEMRKCLPKKIEIGKDGFFIVEKGTDNIRCWCSIEHIMPVIMNEHNAEVLSKDLCVSPQFILDYAPIGKGVWLWEIGKVIRLEGFKTYSLLVDRNPQQFVYTPLSYNQSF